MDKVNVLKNCWKKSQGGGLKFWDFSVLPRMIGRGCIFALEFSGREDFDYSQVYGNKSDSINLWE